MSCEETIRTGLRAGSACGYRTTVVIATVAYTLQVCGYHARAYTPDVRYPLWANLAQLRRLQMANLDALDQPEPR